jgi:AcrR family transcriptional regulator
MMADVTTTPASAPRGDSEAVAAVKRSRGRMTGAERREQLIQTARRLFAERGFDGTSVEEIAARAEVSKPVVYEHFGGKEGVYAVVVDREVQQLLQMMRDALTGGPPRELLEQAALALLDYIEQSSDGFRILVRDSPPGSSTGSYVSIIGDVATRVEHILAAEFSARGFDAGAAPMYAQMLVGMVGTTGQWWLDARKPSKDVVAAHLVNLAWHGLSGLEKRPSLRAKETGGRRRLSPRGRPAGP